MAQDVWNATDSYISDLLIPPDAALDAALAASADAGLPAINVSPTHGKLLQLLARARDAQRILEIGTLGGYSTIWLAQAVRSNGRVISLEADPAHAELARANIARAGLADRVEVRVGKALDTLPQLESERAGPFDLVFIDADKPNTADYFTWSLKLTRPGSLIFVDNVVRAGEVRDPASEDIRVVSMRRFLERLAAEPRVTATVIQTVGMKGYDGFALAVVLPVPAV